MCVVHSNQTLPNGIFTAPRKGETVATATISPAIAVSNPGNDNAVAGGIRDTTPLVAHPEVVRAIRATPRRHEEVLAVLKELVDAGQMPEYREEILVGDADQVSHAELGVSATVVDNRLSRMRAKFRAKLVALGMLALL